MSEPSTTDNAAWKAAQNWINTVTRANQWRVQILSRRYRKDPATGKRKAVPVRIRRFAEGCPAAGMAQALECLLSQAPYTGVIFNGQVLSGSYRPTLTEWRRDDQTVINGQQRTDGTYTLVQDLVEDGFSDDWSGQTTGSCSEKVESMYVWDTDSIQPLPDDWQAQGVTYAIQNVGHQEDGTFSYVLVKRTALTQIAPETPSTDNEYETSSVKTYKNLYGVPPLFRDDSGAEVQVPSPSDTVEVQTKLNDDCTYDVVVQTKVPKAITSENTSSEVIDERTSSVTKRGQAGPLPDAPDAENGLIKTHRSELRPDGKYDTTEQTKQEQEVLDAVVTVSVTRKGRRVTRVNRNQSEAAPTANLEIGSEVKSEKTPGRLFNNTVSTWDRTEKDKVGERCEESLFEHTDESTTSGAAMPGPSDHVVGGGTGGHVKRRVTTVDDEGSIVQTVTDKLEKPVVDAVKETTVTLRGKRVTTVNRNMPSPATPSSAIGSSVRNEKTEGGLVTQTIVETSRDPVGTVKEDCVQSGVEHRHSKTENVVSKPSVEVGPVSSGGTIVEKSVSATEFSTFDVTTVTRTARQAYHEETYGSVGQRTVDTVYRNAADMPVDPGGVNVETRASFSINDFKLLDGHVARTTFVPVVLGPLTAGNTQTTVETTFGKNVVNVPARIGSVNEDVAVSASANDHGSYDYTSRRTVYHSVGPLVVGTATGPLKTVEVKFGKNNVSAPHETAGQNQDFSITATMNEHGSYDWTSRKETYHPYGPVVVASINGTLKSTEIKSAYNQNSVAKETGGQNVDISASASLNSHGSFDWTIRKDTYNPYGPVVVATTTGQYRITTVRAAYNQTKVGSETATTNEELSVSASLNSHGSFDWTSRKDTYLPYGPTLVATTTTPVMTTRHYIGMNNIAVVSNAGNNESSTMSVTMNQHGTFDNHEVIRTPHPLSREASWSSGFGDKFRTHHMVVYRNMENPMTLDGSISASASASINEFGLCDGSAVSTSGDTGGDAQGNTWYGNGGVIEHVELIAKPGGKTRKRTVTINVERMCDRAASACAFAAGGTGYGPYRSGIESSGGRDLDGTPLLIAVRYTNVVFGAEEDI